MVGSWAEACPCHCDYMSGWMVAWEDAQQRKRKPRRTPGAKTCAFKCCRAPELAAGRGVQLLCQSLSRGRGHGFLETLQHAPRDKRAELHAAWTSATSKLFGDLAALAHETARLPVVRTALDQAGLLV